MGEMYISNRGEGTIFVFDFKEGRALIWECHKMHHDLRPCRAGTGGALPRTTAGLLSLPEADYRYGWRRSERSTPVRTRPSTIARPSACATSAWALPARPCAGKGAP
ncbi:hypothetical protein GCM10010300_34290 [Streptomyces olivaceoviridis]|nr:hypothetical protein GCM10010300_34290 [Streptomyces olivaceoviridis]